jgi:hypothetical protein
MCYFTREFKTHTFSCKYKYVQLYISLQCVNRWLHTNITAKSLIALVNELLGKTSSVIKWSQFTRPWLDCWGKGKFLSYLSRSRKNRVGRYILFYNSYFIILVAMLKAFYLRPNLFWAFNITTSVHDNVSLINAATDRWNERSRIQIAMNSCTLRFKILDIPTRRYPDLPQPQKSWSHDITSPEFQNMSPLNKI